ncbi:MAG TPA: sulfatase-like hydrolase/transferase [Candidatus Acidoferrum sp.]|nr:sulfatase-like hydrolase/transferase [Candidatus Acidoferrum sp.]
MSKRPNFLFIITDQQRADHLGAYGNPIVSTPNIDGLARGGFRAEHFYVATPICMPNRATLMTGRMPSLHGVRHNGIELSLEETTFVDVLREAGYRTALVGKAHLQNITGAPAQWPPDPSARLSREARRPGSGRYGQESGTTWEKDPAHELSLPYYGFETVDLSIRHADQQYGHWRRWLRTQTKDADQLIGPDHAVPAPEFELTRCRQAWRTRVPEELYPTSWITERTLGVLRDCAKSDRPFFIQCSYPDPHHPFTPPGKYWSMYAPEDIPLPPSFAAAHRDLPSHVRWLHTARDSGKAVKNTQALFACSEREAREAIALNYGSISLIDESVGRLLAELTRLGQAEDTVVIFTSDHGDFLGDHQLLLKGPIHYRGLVRTPFIWKDPSAPGPRASAALLGAMDFAPTVLARAGVPAFNGIQGASLLPLIAGGATTLRDELLIEEEGQRLYLGFSGRVRMRSLVTTRHRLSVYDGVPWGELYDLGDDPHETSNLWDDPSAAKLRAELMARLARAMLAGAETSPYPSALA